MCLTFWVSAVYLSTLEFFSPLAIFSNNSRVSHVFCKTNKTGEKSRRTWIKPSESGANNVYILSSLVKAFCRKVCVSLCGSWLPWKTCQHVLKRRSLRSHADALFLFVFFLALPIPDSWLHLYVVQPAKEQSGKAALELVVFTSRPVWPLSQLLVMCEESLHVGWAKLRKAKAKDVTQSSLTRFVI